MKFERPDDFYLIQVHRDQIYPMLSSWWPAHGWPVLPREVLPPRGAVGMLGNRMVCATFAYEVVGSSAIWIDYHVTAPDAGLQGAVALQWLIDDYTEALAREGKKYFHSCCRQPSLARLIERAGYTRTDEGVTHFLKMKG